MGIWWLWGNSESEICRHHIIDMCYARRPWLQILLAHMATTSGDTSGNQQSFSQPGQCADQKDYNTNMCMPHLQLILKNKLQ